MNAKTLIKHIEALNNPDLKGDLKPKTFDYAEDERVQIGRTTIVFDDKVWNADVCRYRDTDKPYLVRYETHNFKEQAVRYKYLSKAVAKCVEEHNNILEIQSDREETEYKQDLKAKMLVEWLNSKSMKGFKVSPIERGYNTYFAKKGCLTLEIDYYMDVPKIVKMNYETKYDDEKGIWDVAIKGFIGSVSK